MYPSVIFTSEQSGLRTSFYTAKNLKKTRSGPGLPDLWILQPSHGYHALLIELKTSDPFTKKGVLKKDAHLEEQYHILEHLSILGYCATFAVGVDHAQHIIDWYMGKKLVEKPLLTFDV